MNDDKYVLVGRLVCLYNIVVVNFKLWKSVRHKLFAIIYVERALESTLTDHFLFGAKFVFDGKKIVKLTK